MADCRDYITFSEEKGSINISEEVVAAIAANVALETEGVAALSTSLGKDIAEFLGRKNVGKGVKVFIDESSLRVDMYIVVKPGAPVNRIGAEVQNAVSAEIESATGFAVSEVNVNICGISLEKDK